MKLKKSELVKVYNEKTVRQVCEYLKISETTLYILLREHDIPLKGYRRKDLTIVEG